MVIIGEDRIYFCGFFSCFRGSFILVFESFLSEFVRVLSFLLLVREGSRFCSLGGLLRFLGLLSSLLELSENSAEAIRLSNPPSDFSASFDALLGAFSNFGLTAASSLGGYDFSVGESSATV